MPNLDGKGPEGKGPLTGRKLGKCGDRKNAIPYPRGRRGAGRGFGRGARQDSTQK